VRQHRSTLTSQRPKVYTFIMAKKTLLKLTAKAARARFAELVAEAKAGRASIITYHGRVLAVVVPAQGRSVAAVAAALTGSLDGGRS